MASFAYKGNPDFRGYISATAPEFLPFVGNDGGINTKALNKAGGVESNYKKQSLNAQGAANTIGELWSKFQAASAADNVAGAAAAGNAKPYDPNTDPGHMASLKGQIGNLMSMFQQAFSDVYNKVDQMASDKKRQLIDKYTLSQQGLDKNFGSTATGIDQVQSGRGAFNSSYRATQQGAAKDAYELATGQLNQGEQTDLATVGQTASTQKAQLEAGRPNFNVNDYGTVSDLLNVKNAVDQAVKNVQVSGAGIGTTSQFASQLNGLGPSVQDTGSAQLKSQLDKLAGTNAPNDAKAVIAQHAIDQAGADPAWMDYFHQQIGKTGSSAPATG